MCAYFYFAHKAAGASCARYSLRPLFTGRDGKQTSGEIAPRERETVSTSLRGAKATKQSTLTCFSIVVPAKAGTHNHRKWGYTKAVEQHAKTIGRGVWVPAFAGTTLRDSRARRNDRPRNPRRCLCFPSRHIASAPGLSGPGTPSPPVARSPRQRAGALRPRRGRAGPPASAACARAVIRPWRPVKGLKDLEPSQVSRR